MITRYTRKEMGQIWSMENKFRKWLEVEIAVCEAWAELGKIPTDALRQIKQKASFDIERIDEIEKTVKHDVIAFLTSVAESVGPVSRYIHMGLTSSDVVDTALALQIKEASDLILKDLIKLKEIFKKRLSNIKILFAWVGVMVFMQSQHHLV